VIAVDTSAIIAIIKHEADEVELRAKLNASDGALISTGNMLELQLVSLTRAVGTKWSEIEELLAAYKIVPRPFNEYQLRIARGAAVQFGKGRHKAGLNYGDCFAYALAKSENLPLLCKGEDFAHTDLMLA
jgi:ribonuclease VapC